MSDALLQEAGVLPPGPTIYRRWPLSRNPKRRSAITCVPFVQSMRSPSCCRCTLVLVTRLSHGYHAYGWE